MKTIPPTRDSKAKRAAQEFTKAAEDFERSKISEIKTSRKIAWAITGVFAVLATLGTSAAFVAIVKRTEPEPVVLRVDNSTGSTTMLRSLRDAKDRYDEVVNK